MNEDIYSLLGKYFNGQATEEEQAAVNEWLHSSEENASEFNLLQNVWHASGTAVPPHFDTERAWKKVDNTIKKPFSSQAPVRNLFKVAIGIAASLILVVGLWWVFQSVTELQTIVATRDSQDVVLQDGSIVYLRKGSTLEFPEDFEKTKRHVSLKGEAFFDVKKNSLKPFIITAEEAQVKVLGTSFSVNTSNNKVELIVKTGKVSFSPIDDDGKGIIVSAGERALLAGTTLHKEANRDENFNAWQSRQLVFSNTTLKDVVKTLNEFYNVTISLNKEDSAQIASTGVTTTFKNQSLSSVLNEISLITSYDVQQTGNQQYQIRIKK